MYQQAPRCDQRCLQMYAWPTPKPPGAHHVPVAMAAPGRKASYFKVIATQATKSSTNGGKLVQIIITFFVTRSWGNPGTVFPNVDLIEQS